MLEEPAYAPCVELHCAIGRTLPRFVSVASVIALTAATSAWLNTVVELNRTVGYQPVGCEALVYASRHGTIDRVFANMGRNRSSVRARIEGPIDAHEVSCDGAKA